MTEPVCPVIGQVGQYKSGHPNSGRGLQFPWAPCCREVKHGGVGCYDQNFGKQSGRLVHDPAANVGQAVPQAVKSTAFELVPSDLQPYESEEDGDGKDNQIHGA